MPMGDFDLSINWFAVFAVLFGSAAVPVFVPAVAGAIVAVVLKKQPVWSCFFKGAGIGMMGLMVIIFLGIAALSTGSDALFLALSTATFLVCIVAACYASSREPGATGVTKGEGRSSRQ